MIGGGISALLVVRRGQLRVRGGGRLLGGHAGRLSGCLLGHERELRLDVMTAKCSASLAGTGTKFVDGPRLSRPWVPQRLGWIEGQGGTRKSRPGTASTSPDHGDAKV